MTPVFRAGTPLPIRILVAATGLAFGFTVWTAAWFQATTTGALTTSTALVGLAALCVGFLGLGVARAASAPVLASQINAVIVLVLALFLFAGFPRFPFIALFALMVATAVASLFTIRARSSLAVGIVLIQAALGLYLGWAVVRLATAFPITAPARIPLALWAILSVSSLAAVWHARAIRESQTSSIARAS